MPIETDNTQFGRCLTPCYIFDEAEVERRMGFIASQLPDEVVLCYAMKANPFILQAICGAAGLLEVCSEGEYRICQHMGIPNSRLTISGINKDAAHMRELAASATPVHRFTAESQSQFELLESIAREQGTRLPVLIRITSGNQFGMDAQLAKRLIAEHRDDPHIDLRGIQFFSGTQKSSPARIARELAKIDALIETIRTECGAEIAELEYGPGLPVDYAEQDDLARSAREEEFLSTLRESLAAMSFDGRIILEMGRFMAASCGTYVTSVVDAKVNRGNSYAIVDGGKHQITYYGHELALTPPLCHAHPKRTGAEPVIWTICGSLCTTNDILIKQFEAADLRVGDRLVFPNAGAYCMTEGISLFLSRDLPRIYITDPSGGMRMVRDLTPTYALNTYQ